MNTNFNFMLTEIPYFTQKSAHGMIGLFQTDKYVFHVIFLREQAKSNEEKKLDCSGYLLIRFNYKNCTIIQILNPGLQQV